MTSYAPTIVSRADALRTGAMYYHTGVPCRRGHLAMRYTRSQHCCACLTTKPPGALDNRTVPRVVRMRYHLDATAESRAAFATYLRQCVDAFESHTGAPIATIERA